MKFSQENLYVDIGAEHSPLYLKPRNSHNNDPPKSSKILWLLTNHGNKDNMIYLSLDLLKANVFISI